MCDLKRAMHCASSWDACIKHPYFLTTILENKYRFELPYLEFSTKKDLFGVESPIVIFGIRVFFIDSKPAIDFTFSVFS